MIQNYEITWWFTKLSYSIYFSLQTSPFFSFLALLFLMLGNPWAPRCQEGPRAPQGPWIRVCSPQSLMPLQLPNSYYSYLLDSGVQVGKATPGSGVRGRSVDSCHADSLILLQLPRVCGACSKEGSRFEFSEARTAASREQAAFSLRRGAAFPFQIHLGWPGLGCLALFAGQASAGQSSSVSPIELTFWNQRLGLNVSQA